MTHPVNKDIKQEIEKRYNILTGIIVFAIIVLMGGLFFIQIVKNDYYKAEVQTLTQKTIEGPSAPRGRIYDRNGKLIVDNKADKVIYYQKPSNVSVKDEVKVAYKLSSMIDLDYSKLSLNDLKTFWIKNNKEKAEQYSFVM